MKKFHLLLGILFLLVAWIGPLPELAKSHFFAHMTMHMMVVAISAPLIALGLSVNKLNPADHFPNFFSPIPASMIELIIVWSWHSPHLHHLARNHPLWFILEQYLFLLAGVWVWLSAYGPKRGAGIIALLLTSMHMTFLGALISLSPRALYHQHAHIQDQQIGGVIMLVIGGISYLWGGLNLTQKLLKEKMHEKLA